MAKSEMKDPGTLFPSQGIFSQLNVLFSLIRQFHRSLFLISLVVMVFGGFWGTLWFVNRADTRLREELLDHASAIAQTLNPERIKALSFSRADENRPEFHRLSTQMQAHAEAMNQRMIYTMVLREGEILFGPESMDRGDPYASPPGSVYKQPPPEVHEAFRTGKPITVGPYQDEFGSFVTALVPVLDPRTAEILTVVGLDVEAAVWSSSLTRERWIPILFTSVMLLFFILGYVLLVLRSRMSAALQQRLNHLETVLCVIFMLAITIAVSWLVHDAERYAREKSFKSLARAQAEGVQQELFDLRSKLDSLARFYNASTFIDRGEFRIFAERLTRDSVAECWAWQPVVPIEEKELMEEEAKQEGFEDYRVWQRNEQREQIAVPPRELYYPLLYIEPLSGHKAGLGFDPGSVPALKAALEEADRTGMVTAAEPFPLFFSASQPLSIFIFQPAFNRYQRGFVSTVVSLEALIRKTMYGVGSQETGTASSLFSLNGGESPRFLVSSSPGHHGEECWTDRSSGLTVATPIFAFGKTYVLLLHPEPIWLQENPLRGAWATGLVGLLLTVLLTTLISFLVNQRRLLEQEVQSRTKELRQSEKAYRSLFENAPVGIFRTSSQGQVLSANAMLAGILGFASAEEAVAHYYDVGAQLYRHAEKRQEFLGLLKKDGFVKGFEFEACTVKGDSVWISMNARVEKHVRDGEFIIEGFITDVTERKRSEAERERLMAAMEQAAEMVVITDSDGIIQYVNPAFEFITGYSREEALGKNPRILKSGKQDEAFYREMWQILTSGGTWTGQMVNRRKDGSFYSEEATISPVVNTTGDITNYVAVKRDITHDLELEQQYQQAQKMESVGRLAGGVAHDFNNMLQAILGHAEIALELLKPSEPLYENLVEIQKAAQRSADLTRQLLAFARRQTVRPQVLDLNDTVGSMLKMLQRLIGEDIELIWKPGADLWKVKIDPTQVDQILANLSVNARDAIAGVGALTIETENVSFRGADFDIPADIVPGDYVLLAVSDNGCGMDQDALAHLFEPFFTTKDVGKGTGLGLATVYGIVKQNQGFIKVYSEKDLGTTVKIYLPRERAKDELKEIETPEIPVQGVETVLLVEDDAAILKLGKVILEQYGYTVLAAQSSAQALSLIDQYPGDIHLLVTDVVMPQMNGRELKEKISALRPGIKALFMSGYTADAIAHHGILEEGIHFLQKPFSAYGLAARVREVLDIG